MEEKKNGGFDSCVYCCAMEDRNCRRQQKVRGDTEKLERKEMGRRSETHQLRISFSGHVCACHTRNLTPVALWSCYFVQKVKAKRNKNQDQTTRISSN